MTMQPPPDFPDREDVAAFVAAADDATIRAEVADRGLTPATRRTIVVVLGLVAVLCVAAQVVLALFDKAATEALMTLGAGAIGAIGGMAVPGRE